MGPEAGSGAGGERRGRRCPRCESENTKFCYYNNYSLSQPRHFCKTCRRYWTQGGSLRNIPLGGASRKIKKPTRPSSSSSASGIDHLAGISPAVDFQVAGSGFYPANLSPFGDHHRQNQLVGPAGAPGGPILDFNNSFGGDWKDQRIALPLLYGTGEDKDKDYQKGERGAAGPANHIISNPHHSYHIHGYAASPHQHAHLQASAAPPTTATATPQWLFGGTSHV